MLLNRFASALAFIAVSFAASASAQCAQWSSGLVNSGLIGGVQNSTVFDDGSGVALYVAGTFTILPGTGTSHVARWSGTSWSAVGTLPQAPTALTVADVGSGPRLVAAVGNSVRVWNGVAWSQLGVSFTNNGFGSVGGIYALAMYDAGSGPRLHAAGSVDQGIVQWTGSTWQSVGSGVDTGSQNHNIVSDFAVHDFGSGPELVAVGEFSVVDWIHHNVARWSGSGPWAPVGLGYAGIRAYSVASCDFGQGPTLVVGGDGDSAPHLVQWNGTSWVSFAGGANGDVLKIAQLGPVESHGAGLWISGSFTTVGGTLSAPRLARWDGTSWHATPATTAFSSLGSFARFDDGTGARLYTSVTNGFAVMTSTGWLHVVSGGGASHRVRHLASVARADGTHELWAAGDFYSLGGVTVDRTAYLDASGWHAAPLPGVDRVTQRLRAIDLGDGPEMYAVGYFADLGGQNERFVMRRDVATWIALPNPSGIGSQDEQDLCAFDFGSGPQLYHAGGSALRRLEGGAWSTLATTHQAARFRRLLVHDDGSGAALYFAGTFTTLDGEPCRRIGRFDGVEFHEIGGGADQEIQALVSFDAGNGAELYVAGAGLAELGGIPVQGIGRWNGTSWNPVDPPAGAGVFTPTHLFVHDDGTGHGAELVLGYERRIGSAQPNVYIARGDGTTWRTTEPITEFGPGTNHSTLSAIAAHDAGDGRGAELWIGGNFLRVGTQQSTYIARWESCGGDAVTFCHGDGSATLCPCGNSSPIGARAGCVNSLGFGGTLRADGRASLSADTLRLDGGGMPNSSALYFQSANVSGGGLGVPFGDGVKCTAGPFVRFGTKVNVGGFSHYPEGAELPVSVRGFVVAPGVRHYQVHYRNSASFCTSATFNYTNALTVAWGT